VIVVGLTGSIGMGKSTAAGMLRRMRVPLFDADQAVHELLAPGGAAVVPVAAAFPGVRNATGGIDRRLLGPRVFGNPEMLARLEKIIHPMVADCEKRFLARVQARRQPIAVLDVPLLRQRVMRRPGMTEERFVAILKQQMPDAEKRRRADFVVPTGLDRKSSLRRLRAIVRVLRRGKPRLAGREWRVAHNQRRRGR
jgi:dephospho-CoA kinase